MNGDENEIKSSGGWRANISKATNRAVEWIAIVFLLNGMPFCFFLFFCWILPIAFLFWLAYVGLGLLAILLFVMGFLMPVVNRLRGILPKKVKELEFPTIDIIGPIAMFPISLWMWIYFGGPDPVPGVLAQLKGPNEVVRSGEASQVMAVLESFGDQPAKIKVDSLVGLWDHGDLTVRFWVRVALYRRGYRPDEFYSDEEFLEDEMSEVRRLILSSFDNAQGRESAQLEWNPLDVLEMYSGTSWRTKREVVRALVRWNAEWAVDALEAICRQGDRSFEAESLRALVVVGSENRLEIYQDLLITSRVSGRSVAHALGIDVSILAKDFASQMMGNGLLSRKEFAEIEKRQRFFGQKLGIPFVSFNEFTFYPERTDSW